MVAAACTSCTSARQPNTGFEHVRRPVQECVFARPSSAYGRSKLEATERLMRTAARGRISVTVLRLFNPVGRFSPPGTLPGRAARKIDEAVRTGSDVITLGSLDSWRDFIDVRDVARAVLAVVESMPPSGRVLNVGSGEPVQSRQMVRTLALIAGFYGDIVANDCRSTRSADVDWQCADVEAIAQTLGWSVEYSIENTLADLWSGVVMSREYAHG